jgi:TatA/E family protein of Tat protein translocase
MKSTLGGCGRHNRTDPAMPFFGNPLELVLIVVIALIVFGPAKLPEIMAQVGKAINDFRRATSDLSAEFNRTIQAELQESRAVLSDTTSVVSDVHATVNSAVTGTPAPTRTATPGEMLPAPNGASSEPHFETTTNGTLGEPIKPPLAETTPWSWETSAAPAPAAPSPSAETTATSPSSDTDSSVPTASASVPSSDADSSVPTASSSVPSSAADLSVPPVASATGSSSSSETALPASSTVEPAKAQPAKSQAAKPEPAARDELLPPY